LSFADGRLNPLSQFAFWHCFDGFHEFRRNRSVYGAFIKQVMLAIAVQLVLAASVRIDAAT